MESNLKNSIYLREVPMTADPIDEPFKTEDIMKEDGSAVINQSIKKNSRKYHQYEKTMMNTFDEGYSYNPQRKLFESNSQINDQIQSSHVETRRHKTTRQCHNSFKILLNEYKLQEKPKVDPKVTQRRNKLAEKYEQRRTDKIQHFKSNLLRRIKFEGSDEVQSNIQDEIILTNPTKQAKMHNFLKRQQFFAQQKQILRQMREFCQYGVIKIT